MQTTEAFVVKHQARAEKAAVVKELVDKLSAIISGDRPFAQEIIDLLASASGLSSTTTATGQPGMPIVRPGGSYFSRVVRFFQLTANDWATASAIASGIGVERQHLTNLLYTNHRDQFEQRPNPTAPQKRQWRTKPQLMDSLTRMKGGEP